MRLAAVFLSLAVLLAGRSAEASVGIQSYGWVDFGGMIGVPPDGYSNQYGVGLAFSSGVQFLSYLQVGGRLRLAVTSEKICNATPWEYRVARTGTKA